MSKDEQAPSIQSQAENPHTEFFRILTEMANRHAIFSSLGYFTLVPGSDPHDKKLETHDLSMDVQALDEYLRAIQAAGEPVVVEVMHNITGQTAVRQVVGCENYNWLNGEWSVQIMPVGGMPTEKHPVNINSQLWQSSHERVTLAATNPTELS